MVIQLCHIEHSRPRAQILEPVHVPFYGKVDDSAKELQRKDLP